MEHCAFQDKIFLLADNELPEGERREMAAHSEACGECAGLLRRWLNLQQSLGPASLPEPSESFVDAVLDRLDAPAPHYVVRSQRALWEWLPRLSLGLAGIVLISVLIRPQPVIATETLLLARSPEGSDWEFSPDAPDPGLLLGMPEEAP